MKSGEHVVQDKHNNQNNLSIQCAAFERLHANERNVC